MNSHGRGTGVTFVGSIKWGETQTFGRREYADLVRDAVHVPGLNDSTDLLAVTRTGTLGDDVPIRCLGPDDLLNAWRRSAAG